MNACVKLLNHLWLLVLFVAFPLSAGTLKLQERIVAETGSSFGSISTALSPEKPNLLVSTDWGGNITAWDLQTRTSLWSTFANTEKSAGQGHIHMLGDGLEFLAGHNLVCEESPISLHNTTTGDVVRRFEMQPSLKDMSVTAMQLSPDHRFVVAGGIKNDVQSRFKDCTGFVSRGFLPAPVAIFAMESGRLVSVMKTAIENVLQVGYTPDRARVFALGSYDFAAWNATSGQELKRIGLVQLYGPAYSKCDPMFGGCGPDQNRFVGGSFHPDLRYAALATFNEIILVGTEAVRTNWRWKLPDQLLVRKVQFNQTGDAIFVMASKSYRDKSAATLFKLDAITGQIIERYDGGMMNPPNSLNPFNPGLNVQFLTRAPIIILGDMPAAHVPLRVSVELWKYE